MASRELLLTGFNHIILSNRQQHCVVEGSISKSQRVACGVPQGSILGPLSRFLLYINDLPECLQFTKPHMYADDTILSAAAESTVEVQSRLNQDLFNAGNWLVANKLSINVAKTEHMFFGSNFRLSNLGKTVPIFLGELSELNIRNTLEFTWMKISNGKNILIIYMFKGKSLHKWSKAGSRLCRSGCIENNI